MGARAVTPAEAGAQSISFSPANKTISSFPAAAGAPATLCVQGHASTLASASSRGGGSLILLWIALIGFIPGALYADVLPPGTINQTQAAGQKDELAWPMAKLLYPALKWKKHTGIAEKCLNVCGLDAEDHETNTSLLFTVDLPGEWFVSVSSADVADSGLGRPFWNYNGILQEAGYRQNVPIPDKQICLVGEVADGSDGGTVAYIKRAGTNIRLILISNDTEADGNDANSSGKVGTTTVQVFVSNITPLKQILKEQR